MTEEEKKAINNLWSSATDVMFNVLYSQEEMQEDIKVALNLIQKQQKENIKLKQEKEKKDKKIAEMANNILKFRADTILPTNIEGIKQCFERKVENDRSN